MPRTIRVLCVDDHQLVRTGIGLIVGQEPDMEVVASVESGEEAVAIFAEARPDITLMDLQLGGMTGVEAIGKILDAHPDARIVVVTMYHGDEDVYRAMQAGAVTYVVKTTLADDLIRVIREVYDGRRPTTPEVDALLQLRASQPSLTAREVQILELVAKGRRNKEIGTHLNISEETVRVHIRNVFQKLNVIDRTEAVNVGLRRGIIHLILFLAFLSWPQPAPAQQRTCTAAPPAPRNIKAAIDAAIPAAAATPPTPAVLRLTWQASGSAGLANAAAQYVIEAGSQPGLTDVGVTRTAGPELSFTIPMANGNYYLRVRSVNPCGSGSPSPDTRVRVSGSVAPAQPNPLVILDTIQATRERLASSAFVRVMGQVRNGWNAAPAAFVTATVTYEGTRGSAKGTQSSFVTGTSGRLKKSSLFTDTVIRAGDTGCFVMFAQFNAADVTGLGIVAAPSLVEVVPLPSPVAIESPSLAADEFDGLVVAGRASNDGSQMTIRNEMWVEARDATGRVLDCRGTSIAAQAFRNVTEAPFSLSRLVRWWTTWEAVSTSPTETSTYRQLRAALDKLLEDPAGSAPEDVTRARDDLRREALRIERDARGQ